MLMSKPLLALHNVHVAYGAIRAVHGVSLELYEGELVSLIGANGAGKTTVLKTISGLLPASQGDIFYGGQPLANIAPHDRIRAGLALVPEGRGIFPQLTVAENLYMGAYIRNDKAAIHHDLDQQYQRFPRLLERRHQLAGTLSGGEQQMLALARALMARPKLLLLDEPSMGLAPLMVQKIFEVIREVAAAGVTILLVEQNARAALRLATRGYVMEHGEITLADNAAALLANPAVQATYLGG
jgi:branched-chain amino acid transport system ATP-binding protein